MININEDQEKEITVGMWQLLVEKDLLISSMFSVLQKVVILIPFNYVFICYQFTFINIEFKVCLRKNCIYSLYNDK